MEENPQYCIPVKLRALGRGEHPRRFFGVLFDYGLTVRSADTHGWLQLKLTSTISLECEIDSQVQLGELQNTLIF